VSRRVGVIVLVAAAGLALVVAIGRWERGNHADRQNEGMREVVADVGSLDSPRLSAFRYLAGFQCLLYRSGSNPLALEVCVDRNGRVIEAIDRRAGGDPKIWSLREDPDRTSVRVDRATVDRLLIRMGVPRRLIDEAHRTGL
jgi:hypothetical protein